MKRLLAQLKRLWRFVFSPRTCHVCGASARPVLRSPPVKKNQVGGSGPSRFYAPRKKDPEVSTKPPEPPRL